MTTLSRITLVALAIAAALASTSAFAQPSANAAPLTRAQVRADLVDWLNAGFDPFDWINYPDNARRAHAIVLQRRAERAGAGQMQSQ